MMKEYLGDSVYAELDPWFNLVLTTENGYGPNNTIILEPEVIDSLNSYLRQREDYLRIIKEKLNVPSN